MNTRVDFQSWTRPRRGSALDVQSWTRPRRRSALDFQSRARPRRGLHWIFSRGPDRDEGCTGFLVVGETEIRVALDF